MELVHATGMQAGYTMGMKPDGRELLVVVVKGTFTIPQNGGEPMLAETQVPLVMADTFSGEPGLSAPVYESDFAPRKPLCDVLLNGSAYAPRGRPATRVPVSLQVGRMSKSFMVVGDRFWLKSLGSVKATEPLPFRAMPITYDRAFGGSDFTHPDPSKHGACRENTVGVGFHVHVDPEALDRKQLPNTEEAGNPIIKPIGSYRPMAFGPIGRGWQPRVRFAGTYDQNWLDNIFPFLPPDFDEQYYQAAPPDQQMPYPEGAETVALTNLTPEGRTVFRLPRIQLLVWFFLKNGEEQEARAVIDAVVIEPDQRRFMVSWRASLPLKKNMFEVVQVVVGPNPEDKYQGRDPNAPPFPVMEEAEEEGSDDTEKIAKQEEEE
jgi:hypothetical protein